MWYISNGEGLLITTESAKWKDENTNPQELLQQLYDQNSGVKCGVTYRAFFEVRKGRHWVTAKEAFVWIA